MLLFSKVPDMAQLAAASLPTKQVDRSRTEWPQYAGDKASTKYSPLDQITAENFGKLKVAWTWRSVEEDIVKAKNLKTWAWEVTPLMVDGVLYLTTSLSQAAALDAATGKTLWVFDPETWKNGTPSNNGFVHRGVSYWSDGQDRRIVFGTGDGYLICLHAETGKPVRSFGNEGRIDLTHGLGRPMEHKLYGVSSPPIICRDVIVMGSKSTTFRLPRKCRREMFADLTFEQANSFGASTRSRTRESSAAIPGRTVPGRRPGPRMSGP
jgi:quinoprotein glucose dehydrogenase